MLPFVATRFCSSVLFAVYYCGKVGIKARALHGTAAKSFGEIHEKYNGGLKYGA